jgi:hypothetical protein
MSMYPEWSATSFPTKVFKAFLNPPMHTTRTAHLTNLFAYVLNSIIMKPILGQRVSRSRIELTPEINGDVIVKQRSVRENSMNAN